MSIYGKRGSNIFDFFVENYQIESECQLLRLLPIQAFEQKLPGSKIVNVLSNSSIDICSLGLF